MSTDFTKIQMSSSASSNKVLIQGTNNFSVAALAGAGETFGVGSVAHNFGSDNLLYQVSTTGGPTDGAVLPWSSNDGRIMMYARVDTINLYVFCISSDSSGFGAPGFNIVYYYRVLIP
jgi:hypothetical protein